jgi:hypothetical protein
MDFWGFSSRRSILQISYLIIEKLQLLDFSPVSMGQMWELFTLLTSCGQALNRDISVLV